MEFFACILGGLGLIVFSLSLFRIRPPEWHEDDDNGVDDGRPGDCALESECGQDRASNVKRARFQRNVRYLNNVLLAIAGGAIVSSAFVPHGRSWMLLWTAILVVLLFCIMFAMIDALTSLAGYRNALPVAARRTLGDRGDQS